MGGAKEKMITDTCYRCGLLYDDLGTLDPSRVCSCDDDDFWGDDEFDDESIYDPPGVSTWGN